MTAARRKNLMGVSKSCNTDYDGYRQSMTGVSDRTHVLFFERREKTDVSKHRQPCAFSNSIMQHSTACRFRFENSKKQNALIGKLVRDNKHCFYTSERTRAL